jgi:hypothetical protein
MSKRWTKQKAAVQKSRQRKAKAGAGPGSATGATGTMGGLRGFFKMVAGTKGGKGPRSGLEKVFDIALWIAVVAALFYFVSKQCT